MIFGSLMVATGLLLAQTGNALSLLVGYGVFIGLLGNAAMNAPLYTYVSRWFDRCGTALALLGSGSSVSAAIWAPIFAAAEAQIGWRNTLSVWRNGAQAVTLSIQTAAVRRRDLMEPASDGRLIHSNEPNPVRAANGGFRGISCQIAMRR
jgi:MFS family permease